MSSLRSPKNKEKEMVDLLKIIHAYKKNKKVYFNTPPQSIIKYDEPLENKKIEKNITQESIKKPKQKVSSDKLNLKCILEEWQNKQIFMKDTVVSNNITKNLIFDPFCCKTDKHSNYYYNKQPFLSSKRSTNINKQSLPAIRKATELTEPYRPNLQLASPLKQSYLPQINLQKIK